jgi:hypothetical protein
VLGVGVVGIVVCLSGGGWGGGRGRKVLSSLLFR